MLQSGRFTAVLLGIWLATTCIAEEVVEVNDVSEDDAAALQALLEESEYASRWRLKRASEAAIAAEEMQATISPLEFQDASGIARLAQLRTLSFLTLAHSGDTRLFLGVNQDGLVGLHYRAVSKKNDAEYRELARMPYIDGQEPDESSPEIDPLH